MSLTDDEDVARRLAARLEELGVTSTDDQVLELASAYPALMAWMRIAEELAEREVQPAPEME